MKTRLSSKNKARLGTENTYIILNKCKFSLGETTEMTSWWKLSLRKKHTQSTDRSSPENERQSAASRSIIGRRSYEVDRMSVDCRPMIGRQSLDSEQITKSQEIGEGREKNNLAHSTKKDRPTRKTAKFWHNVGQWSHDSRPICPFKNWPHRLRPLEMWLRILYRRKLWLMSGRRSGEQWAKDSRYQATVGLWSVDKRTSSEQSGDYRSIVEIGERRHKITTWHHRQQKGRPTKKTTKQKKNS